jgi:hypothetical protein
MRKLSMMLVVVFAALLSQSGHAFTVIDDHFESYSRDINPATVFDFKTLAEGTTNGRLPEYVAAKTAYYGATGIIPNSPLHDSVRPKGIFGIYNFVIEFASALELEPSTILLLGIGILGLLTYRKKRSR